METKLYTVRPNRQAETSTRLRLLRLDQISADDVAAWHALEAQALEPNAFLSPHFLLPAMRHLDPRGHARLALLETLVDGRHELVAAIPLEPCAANRVVPLPHYQVQESPHTFVSGLLVRRDGAEQHLEHLLRHWKDCLPHAIVFPSCRVDGPTDRLLQALCLQRGLMRVELDAYDRAAMHPHELGDADLAHRLPSRAKKLKAQKCKLSKLGEVRFVVHRGADITADVIERHLSLEHMGWKGQEGTSMRSDPRHEAFFIEMTGSFARADRAFFAELWVGSQVIASSSNLTSGASGFAFKVSFDPAYSAHSPGVLGELELMRCAPEVLADLSSVDSGAIAGSYIDDLWPRRHRMATVAYASSKTGYAALKLGMVLRAVKQRWPQRAPAASGTVQ